MTQGNIRPDDSLPIALGLTGVIETVNRRNAILVPLLCGLIQMLDGYDLSAIGLIAPSLMKEWALPAAAFTEAFALSSVGIMVGAIIAGPVADRFGRRPMLLLSVLAFGIFSLLSAWAPSLGWLVALRFLTGVGIGGAMPTTVALTADHVPERWCTTVIMFMFCGNALGGFVAGQTAAIMIPYWGWHGIFVVGGAVPLAMLPVLLVLPESNRFHLARAVHTAPRNPVAGLFSRDLARTTLLLSAIFLFNLFSMYLIGYWLPTVLNLEGLTPAEAAATASFGAAGGIISTLILGPLLGRFRPEWVLAGNIALGLLAIAGIVLGRPDGVALKALVFGTGAGFVGSQLGLNGFAAAAYPTALRSTGIGWALGVGRLGGILGPVFGGVLLGLKFAPPSILLSVWVPGTLTVAAILLLGRRRGGSRQDMRWKTQGRPGFREGDTGRAGRPQ